MTLMLSSRLQFPRQARLVTVRSVKLRSLIEHITALRVDDVS